MRVVYLCDRKKCENCSELCKYTNDINHAANFKKDGDNYIENSNTEVLREEIAALRALCQRLVVVEDRYHELLKETFKRGRGETVREQS